MLKSLADFTLIFISGLTHEDSFQRGQWRHSTSITACDLILIASGPFFPLFQVKASQGSKQKQAFIFTLLKEQIRAMTANPSLVQAPPTPHVNSSLTYLRGPGGCTGK